MYIFKKIRHKKCFDGFLIQIFFNSLVLWTHLLVLRRFATRGKKRREIELWRYRHLLIMSFGPPFVTVYFSYRGVPRLFPFVSLTGAYWREIQYRRPFKKRPLSVNFLILTKAFLGFFPFVNLGGTYWRVIQYRRLSSHCYCYFSYINRGVHY